MVTLFRDMPDPVLRHEITQSTNSEKPRQTTDLAKWPELMQNGGHVSYPTGEVGHDKTRVPRIVHSDGRVGIFGRHGTSAKRRGHCHQWRAQRCIREAFAEADYGATSSRARPGDDLQQSGDRQQYLQLFRRNWR